MQERGVHPGYAPLRGRVLTDDPASLATLTGCAEGQTIAAMPAYNEEQYIAKTIVGAYRYVDLVLVIDDGSSDATVEIAQALGALVIRHRTNLGYGGALRTIFSVSRTLGAGALVILDSDGQHSPDDLPALLNGLDEGSDVVIGSRFLDGSKGDIPAYRKVGMKVLDTATQFAGGDLKVSDSQSGFRAYGRRAIEAVHVTGEGMSAGSEILIQAADAGLAISEVPITVRYDIEGTSSENPVSHGFSVLGNIVGMISYRRPLLSFGIPGFIAILCGLTTGFLAFSEYYATTRFPFALSMVTAVVLILGLLLVIAGLILNALMQVVRSSPPRQQGMETPYCRPPVDRATLDGRDGGVRHR